MTTPQKIAHLITRLDELQALVDTINTEAAGIFRIQLPAETFTLLAGQVSFSEPAAVAELAQQLQASAAAKGQTLSASQAVAKIRKAQAQAQASTPSRPLKPYRQGGPSIIDIPFIP
jgi:hypothetical protein